VISSSDTALISLDHASPVLPTAWAALGCLRASGRERLLTIQGLTPPPNGMGPTNLAEAAVAGNYAALAMTSGGGRYGFSFVDSRSRCSICELASRFLIEAAKGSTAAAIPCRPLLSDRSTRARQRRRQRRPHNRTGQRLHLYRRADPSRRCWVTSRCSSLGHAVDYEEGFRRFGGGVCGWASDIRPHGPVPTA
jgi:hypothetical protein